MDEKQYISSVKMEDGSIYMIKDKEAHEMFSNLFEGEIIIDCGGAPIDAIN
jgi:hypothetical protein